MEFSRGPPHPRIRMNLQNPPRFPPQRNHYHHQQPPPPPPPQHLSLQSPRQNSNMAWQQSSMAGYQQPHDNNVLHFSQQQNAMNLEGFQGFLPAFPQNIPSSDMMTPTNSISPFHHITHQGQVQVYAMAPQMQISPPIETVLSPTMPVMPVTQAPAVSSKYSGPYAALVKCAACGCENHALVNELYGRDQENMRLVQQKKLLEETNQLLRSEVMNLREACAKVSLPAIDQKLSKLSPDAAEFRPDENNQVPVVSLKGITDEPSSECEESVVKTEPEPEYERERAPPPPPPHTSPAPEQTAEAPQAVVPETSNTEDTVSETAVSAPVSQHEDWSECEEVEVTPQVDNCCQTTEEVVVADDGVVEETTQVLHPQQQQQSQPQQQPLWRSASNTRSNQTYNRNNRGGGNRNSNYHQAQFHPRNNFGKVSQRPAHTSYSQDGFIQNVQHSFQGSNSKLYHAPRHEGRVQNSYPGNCPITYQEPARRSESEVELGRNCRENFEPGSGQNCVPRNESEERKSLLREPAYNSIQQRNDVNKASKNSKMNNEEVRPRSKENTYTGQKDQYSQKYGDKKDNQVRRNDKYGGTNQRLSNNNEQEGPLINWDQTPNQQNDEQSQYNKSVDPPTITSEQSKDVSPTEPKKKPRDYLTEAKDKKTETGGIRIADRHKDKDSPRRMVIEEKGDVFSAPDDVSLAHCVAKDFRMGSGIAVKFKSEFKCVAQLLSQNVEVGGCAYLQVKKRYVFYLVTKEVSHGKPSYESLRNSLMELKRLCLEFKLTKLAIPRLGTGLDKLQWIQVRSIINEVFTDTQLTITAYEWNQEGVSEFEGNKAVSPTLKVIYKVMPLLDMERNSVLIFFSTEDGYLDSTANKLENRFRFANDFKIASKGVGKVWCFTKNVHYWLCGLIVAKTYSKNTVNFQTLESCVRELYKFLKTMNVQYIAFEAFKDWSSDPVFNEKVVTLMRIIVHRPVDELWVCFPSKEDDPYDFTDKLAREKQLSLNQNQHSS